MKKQVQVIVHNLHGGLISPESKLSKEGHDLHFFIAEAAGNALGIDPDSIGVSFKGRINARGVVLFKASVFSVSCISASNNHNCDPRGKVEKAIIALLKDLCGEENVPDIVAVKRQQLVAEAGEIWLKLATLGMTGQVYKPH